MKHSDSHKAYIGIGSNMGDRAAMIRKALAYLESEGSVDGGQSRVDSCERRAANGERRTLGRCIKIEQISSFYETEPVGGPPQGRFINGAVSVRTRYSPHCLLECCKRAERALGRAPGVRYGPRPIDLDILFYDDEVLETADLVIPHPRLAERLFVLMPLAEIAPEYVHPVLGVPVKELLQRLTKRGSPHPAVSMEPSAFGFQPSAKAGGGT
ncbi:MAG: 2-amino-4-hydroxy-6-hydroxymethyldihydropteridine diphosphokinase [Candidatus Omnitrophica bacterium]|nr:2-amino-4-hydroxy-6-hydroxymethyldihydropteridine diphosphokinase [Candidatus Omnitrophota bacterium]